MPNNISKYDFECYGLDMSPAERREYLLDHETKLDDVIFGTIEEMTTNEKITLWRKLYGNSHSASPLISHLGATINSLFEDIELIKNQKKGQLRKKTMEKNSIKNDLNKTVGSLRELSSAYMELKNELEKKNNSTSESQKLSMDKLAYEIREATTREVILLESIEYLSNKIKQHGVIISITEMPHHKVGIKPDDLLKNKTFDLFGDK